MKEKNEKDYLLTQGPFPKSTYTYQLEAVVRKLLRGVDFDMTYEASGVCFKFKGEEVAYNMSDITHYANFQHLNFTSDNSVAYEKYLKSHAILQSKLKITPEIEKKYEALSKGEMHAVNIYTGDGYKQLNQFMRGGIHGLGSKKETKDTILHAVFCASALTKVPTTTIKQAYRSEQSHTPFIRRQRKKAAENKGVIKLSGFVSASKEDADGVRDTKFEFKNLIGLDVEDLSQHKEEREFLIPPTMIQITNYYEDERGRDCFCAEPVRDVSKLNQEEVRMPTVEERDSQLIVIFDAMEEYLDKTIQRIQSSKAKHDPKSDGKIRKFASEREAIQALRADFKEHKVEFVDMIERIGAIAKKVKAIADEKRGLFSSKSSRDFVALKQKLNDLKENTSETKDLKSIEVVRKGPQP
jgi:hypothetical protein